LRNLYKTSILREYPRFKIININRNKILRKKLAVTPDYLEMKRKISTLFSTNKTKLSTIPILIKKDILLREQLYATINENNVKNIRTTNLLKEEHYNKIRQLFALRNKEIYNKRTLPILGFLKQKKLITVQSNGLTGLLVHVVQTPFAAVNVR